MTSFGPKVEDNGVTFTLWAPYQKDVKVKVLNKGVYEMERDDLGYFRVHVNNASIGDRYKFILDKMEIPDPASRYQPEGVHGYSEIISPNNDFLPSSRIKTNDLIIYELHVGTFTKEGTFESAISKLDYLKELGVTAIEVMPVAQFPGKRDWGYDGVYLYAVQNSYGGPLSFKKFINEAHRRGLAVILDVVYNHVGPEGNYMTLLGPYFSSKYSTPWGLTFNFDDSGSDEVRKFVLENVEFWIKEYNVDGFRLDAVHAIIDNSPKHILEDIADVVHKYERIVIAESDLNDPKIINPKEKCGYNNDAQWVDDFHHSIHAFLTGERSGYYADFGSIDDIVKSYRDVFVYDGKYSKFRKKTHGRPVKDLNGCKFVVYIQNHDQVGNRGDGKRLIELVDKESYKIASALYLLSPYIPMIFMGEEYGEKNPFYYFSDFSEPKLIQGVREGRRRDNGQKTDPQSEETFNASKLSWNIDEEILSLYKNLIKVRRDYLAPCSRNLSIDYGNSWIIVKYERIFIIYVFSESTLKVNYTGNLVLSSSHQFPREIKEGVYTLSKGFAVYKH